MNDAIPIPLLALIWVICGVVNTGILYPARLSEPDVGKNHLIESWIIGQFMGILGPIGPLFLWWVTGWCKHGWKIF